MKCKSNISHLNNVNGMDYLTRALHEFMYEPHPAIEPNFSVPDQARHKSKQLQNLKGEAQYSGYRKKLEAFTIEVANNKDCIG